MWLQEWTERELRVVRDAPGAFVIAVALVGSVIFLGVDKFYGERIAFLENQLEFKSAESDVKQAAPLAELKTLKEEVREEGGVYTVARTVEVVSPFVPSALKIGVWAEFEERLAVVPLEGGNMQTRELFNNPRGAMSDNFGGIEIVSPHGKYVIIIKTKYPNDIKIEHEFG